MVKYSLSLVVTLIGLSWLAADQPTFAQSGTPTPYLIFVPVVISSAQTTPNATSTNVPASPTTIPTNTVSPTATQTPTNTLQPPTATATNSPTATSTNVIPTSTDTPLPTATSTNVIPTSTDTPLPTATSTNVIPTSTDTPLPTVTSTSSPTITPTQTPKALDNPGFELGTTGWVFDGGFISAVAHTGQKSARLSPPNDSIETITQRFTVPLTATKLTYWYQTSSSEFDCFADTGYVWVDPNPDDTVFSAEIVASHYEFCDSDEVLVWTKKTANIAKFAGKTVELQFEMDADILFDSYWYIDDVATE